ncbi:reverse transcriptase domain-containing protein [Tanacetum coccineum]
MLHLPKPEKSLRFFPKEVIESENLFLDRMHGEVENTEDIQMADHLRPMEELLRIPTEGIEDAIIIPAVLANELELKIELLDFISNNPFFGLENDDPHSHIKRFYQITLTLKINQVPHDVVKLILFPFSLKGAADTWLENEPPCSITTWDDLVSKFLNRFYPHSKTRELRKEITNF